MDPRDIARIAYEVNRAYCQSIGDLSQLPWDEAPDWQKQSALDGVHAVMSGRVKSPGDSHANWFAHKQANGWVWGPEKNPELKQHPCMVLFWELPIEQQIKDHLFVGTVKACLLGREEADSFFLVHVRKELTTVEWHVEDPHRAWLIDAMRISADSIETSPPIIDKVH